MLLKHCIFPVAGYGTRFLPITKSVPKELLPIGSKPLIQFAVEEAFGAGINQFVFITNRHKNAIKNYFSPFKELEDHIKDSAVNLLLEGLNSLCLKSKFSFLYQEKMNGLGAAIQLANTLNIDSPFAVILPDDLCYSSEISVLEQMIQIHRKFPDKCIVALEEVEIESVSSYGIIHGNLINNYNNLYSIESLIEKPSIDIAPSNLAVIGRYILTPSIFKILKDVSMDKNNEIQITDALNEMAKNGQVLGLKFTGNRFDCGKPAGLIEANNFFL